MADPLPPEPASLGTLAIATAVSLAVAAIALSVLILPQSYGIDPTGLGGAMGFEPDPDPREGPSDGATERTLLIGANRTFTFPFEVPAHTSLHVTWNSTGPLTLNLTGPPDGAPVEATWGGNATWQATTFTATEAGRYALAWTNERTEPVTVRLRIAEAHP